MQRRRTPMAATSVTVQCKPAQTSGCGRWYGPLEPRKGETWAAGMVEGSPSIRTGCFAGPGSGPVKKAVAGAPCSHSRALYHPTALRLWVPGAIPCLPGAACSSIWIIPARRFLTICRSSSMVEQRPRKTLVEVSITSSGSIYPESYRGFVRVWRLGTLPAGETCLGYTW